MIQGEETQTHIKNVNIVVNQVLHHLDFLLPFSIRLEETGSK